MTKIKINLADGRSMTAQLDESAAPITCANFLKLVDSNFYNGLIFHRVIPNFMIQGGGMDASLSPKEAKPIKGEFKQNGVNNPITHKLGVLSMARTNDPNSASSQFFICVDDCSFLVCGVWQFGRQREREGCGRYLQGQDDVDILVSRRAV